MCMGAVGKGPQGTSLAAYPTARPVLRGGGGSDITSLPNHITMDGTYEQASHVTFFLPSSRHATEHITRSGCPMTTGAASSWARAIMAVRTCPCSATCLAMQTMQALDGWQRCMLSAGTSPMAAGGLRCAWAPCEVVRMRPHTVLTALDL
jgi:hypothetical protein